jgi:hypothetical protein
VIFKNKKNDELIVTCKRGCGYGLHWQAGTFTEDADEEYYLTLVEMSWYAKRDRRLSSYFKRFWKALRGKEYYLTEMILKKDEVEEFAEFLHRLTNKSAKEATPDGND